MLNDEELCIKYLMNELDPSEKILVENKMHEDPNILIEIESLRSTLNKLDNLPVLSPPEEITQSIVSLAGENKRTIVTPVPLLGSLTHNVRYWGAAAVLVLSVSVGSYFLFSSNTQAVKMNVPASNASIEAQQTSSSTSNQVKPWVDRNDVIYITPTTSSQTASTTSDTALSNSLKKLRPLNNPLINSNQQSQSLQLARDKQQ